MSPFPTKITQSEKQFVLFSSNHYYYTPYTVKKQTTTVSLATSSVESHSKLKPTSLSDNSITYGPYSDAEAFQVNPMRVHFENNTPFLSVSEHIVYTFHNMQVCFVLLSRLAWPLVFSNSGSWHEKDHRSFPLGQCCSWRDLSHETCGSWTPGNHFHTKFDLYVNSPIRKH